MRNELKENTNTNLAERARPKEFSFFKLLLWVFLGGSVAYFIKKFFEVFSEEKSLPHNPPIIIKSESFIVRIKKPVGNLEGDSSTKDDDQLGSIPGDYNKFMVRGESIRCVVIYKNERPIKCIKCDPDDPDGRFIIKFHFGDCPSGVSRPDILVKGANFRIRYKRALRRESSDDSRYYYHRTPGNNLCAVIYWRVGGGGLVPQGGPIKFPSNNSIILAFDSDPSKYDCERVTVTP